MKAITIKVPWSWAISHGPKRIENRTWNTHQRGTIAIHAGKGWDKAGEQSNLVQAAWAQFAADLPPLNCHRGPLRRDTLWMTFGAIVAVADLVDVCGAAFADPAPITCGCGPWAARGQYHWKLANVRPLTEPVPCKGALGLWTLPSEIEAAVPVPA